MKRSGKVFTRSLLQQRSILLLCALAVSLTVMGYWTSTHALAFVDETQQSASAKRPMTHQDYDSWRSIQAPQISRDGKFVAYAFQPQDGDGEVVVRNVASGVEWRAARGYRPPIPPPDDPGANIAEFQANQARLVRPVFTADSKYVVFSIEPLKADVNKAKKDKKKPEDMPKNAMGIIDLANGTVTRIEKVKNFQVPEDGSGFIAYLLEPKPEEKPPAGRDASTTNSTPQSTPGGATPTTSTREPQAGGDTNRPARGQKKKEYGSDLILRNMTAGSELTFSDVLDYSFTKDAKTLVFAVSSRTEDTNGVYAVNTQASGNRVELLRGKGKYQKLTWDEDNNQLGFISDRDDADAKQPKFKVYYWPRNASAPQPAMEIASNSSVG